MNSLAIVALPAKDDYVNRISSEKVPHMTLLFLGEDATKVQNLDKIMKFVEHAAETSLTRFGMEVDRRDVLGPDLADVLIFSKTKWTDYSKINDYRSYLLKENNIRIAYDSTTQFPEWVPHLTLGYPETPAKPDDRDYPGLSYVTFDRIAVWFNDYSGVEFPLKSHNWDADVAMSGMDMAEAILEHHGIKGMKWGVQRRLEQNRQIRSAEKQIFKKHNVGNFTTGLRPGDYPRIAKASRERHKAIKEIRHPSKVTTKDSGRTLKTYGGHGRPAHPDAVRARKISQVGKKSGLKALSNEELQAFNQRLNLEQQAKRLQFNDQSPPKKFVLTLLGQTGKQQASELTSQAASSQVKKILKAA